MKLTIKTLRYGLVDVGGDVLFVEVDDLDLWTQGLGKCEPGWDGVDSVDFGGSFKQRPLDNTQLQSVLVPLWRVEQSRLTYSNRTQTFEDQHHYQ